MLSLVLSLALSQVGVGQQPAPEELRLHPRFRLGVGATGGLMLLRPGGLLPGFGVELDCGAIFGDRVSLSVRPNIFTNVGFWVFGAKAGADYALSERFALGVGAGITWSAGLESGTFVNLFAPVRLTFAPLARHAGDVSRSGLLLGLEVAPGALVTGTPGRFSGPVSPAPSFSAMLTVGWAMW